MASPTGITTRPYNRLTPPSSSPSHLCHPKTTSLIILPTPSTITTPSPTNDASTRNYHHTYGISNQQYYKTLQPLDTTIILTITPPSPNNDFGNNATNTSTITTPSPTNDTSTRNYHHTTISPSHPPMASLTTLQPLDSTIIFIITPLSAINYITNNTTYTTTIITDTIHNTTTAVTNIPPS